MGVFIDFKYTLGYGYGKKNIKIIHGIGTIHVIV